MRADNLALMRYFSLFTAGLLAATLAVSASAPAQTAAPSTAPAAPAGAQTCGGGQGPNPMQGIQLTPAQKQQIKQIRSSFRAQYPCGTKVPPQARQQMRSQILGVLTPAQQAQYQANMSAMHSPPPN